ncbi:MAG: thiol peroxidase [Chryseobacterium sp.]|nr:MAG: thiol peroxidase [Chryseobacterium sp.]
MADITFHDEAAKTVGSLPEKGTELKNFTLVAEDLSEKTLSDYKGKKIVMNIFPSIDTGVCAAAARKFNEEASGLDNTVVLNISRDLPFALKRFCAAEGLDDVVSLSDFRGSFGEDYGVTLADSPLKGLLSRAVIVADENGKILYTEQVNELTHEPNYEAAVAALK